MVRRTAPSCVHEQICQGLEKEIPAAQPLELSVRGSLGGTLQLRSTIDPLSLSKSRSSPLPSRPDTGAGASLQIVGRQTIANTESEKGLHLHCICAAPHSASGPQLRLCRSRPAHLPRSNWGLVLRVKKESEREKKGVRKRISSRFFFSFSLIAPRDFLQPRHIRSGTICSPAYFRPERGRRFIVSHSSYLIVVVTQ